MIISIYMHMYMHGYTLSISQVVFPFAENVAKGKSFEWQVWISLPIVSLLKRGHGAGEMP